MKIKITKEHVKNAVKGFCILAYSAAAIAGAVMTRSETRTPNKYYVGMAGYSDAVKVIVESSMFDSNKKRAIELLKRDGDAGYYNSVISVVNSSMFDSNKIEAIKMMSKKIED
jgi:hypothetical protein